MAEFQKGQKIPISIGGEATVIQRLGEGGQGFVYKVSYNGKDYALKWYKPKAIKNPKKFYSNLESNIKKGAPTKAFLWPQFLTKQFDGSFGYLMDLRPQEYKDFSMFLLAKARFSSMTAVVNAALNIVNGFRDLHRCGFSYQDLNDGNFFVNPDTGDVLICDNDNVAPFGESLGIAGKCRYMAPEVVLNKKRPDTHTDRFSLSVVLFLLLFMNHPLEGKRTMSPCLTEELERKFFGSEPVFIFDPSDDSNRPVRGVHINTIRRWPVFPQYVRDMFVKAFSKEVMSGQRPRVTDNEWQKLFTQLRDNIIKCPKCGNETFVVPGEESACMNCGNAIPKLPHLKVGKYDVVMYPGKHLYLCHTDPDTDDFATEEAVVLQNPQKPQIWGLRNTSEKTWYYDTKDGEQKPLGPNDVAVVLKVKSINFGKTSGIMIY